MLTAVANGLCEGFIAYRSHTAFPYTLWACLAGMFGFGSWFSQSLVLNNPTWYISVLLLCYAVFYFAVFLSKRLHVHANSTFLVTVTIGVLMCHVCSTYNNFSMPLFSMSIGRGLICFFLGLLLRSAMDTYKIHEKTPVVLTCAVYLTLFVIAYVKFPAFLSSNLHYLLCFTVFPSVLLLFKSIPMQKLCSGKLFSCLGNISYHTFMWHVFVLVVSIQIFGALQFPVTSPAAGYISLILALLAGALSYSVKKAMPFKNAR